jgi:zinc transport system substrate-binding protein
MPFPARPLHYLLILALLTLALAGCGSRPNQAVPATAGKLKVVASVYPVYEFARQVGGDRIELTMLVPPGAEPHDWEPTAREMVAIKSAKLFLYHGAGFENIDKLLTKEALGATQAVAVSDGIPVIKGDDDHDHHGGHADSHIWLDPVLAQREVATIAAALEAADPQNAAHYRQNADRFSKELAALDGEYRSGLENLPGRTIVTSHAAFGYLTKRYNLEQMPIMGLSPDSEPTPERLAAIVRFCRQHNVKYIFFETIVNPRLAETLAKETGARLLVLNPLENLTEAEVKQGKNYLVIMRENLTNLRQALQ